MLSWIAYAHKSYSNRNIKPERGILPVLSMKKKSHCGTSAFGPSNLVWLDLREELVNR